MDQDAIYAMRAIFRHAQLSNLIAYTSLLRLHDEGPFLNRAGYVRVSNSIFARVESYDNGRQ